MNNRLHQMLKRNDINSLLTFICKDLFTNSLKKLGDRQSANDLSIIVPLLLNLLKNTDKSNEIRQEFISIYFTENPEGGGLQPVLDIIFEDSIPFLDEKNLKYNLQETNPKNFIKKNLLMISTSITPKCSENIEI